MKAITHRERTASNIVAFILVLVYEFLYKDPLFLGLILILYASTIFCPEKEN